MTEKPLVSIGMTSFFRPDGLRRCLLSMINQTYKNIKIHLAIDYSQKQSEVIKSIEDLLTDTRIDLIRHQSRKGMHPNLKAAFERSEGEYFLWADDDDYHEPTFIESGVTFLEANPEYSAWFPTMDNISPTGFVYQKYPSFERFTSSDNKENDIIKFIEEPEIRGKCNLMYSIFRTSCLKDTINAYFLNDSWGTDNSFMIAFLTRFKIKCSKEVLFHKGNYAVGNIQSCGSAEDLELCYLGFPSHVGDELKREMINASEEQYKNIVGSAMQQRINRIKG